MGEWVRKRLSWRERSKASPAIAATMPITGTRAKTVPAKKARAACDRAPRQKTNKMRGIRRVVNRGIHAAQAIQAA